MERASGLHPEGHRFDPDNLHQFNEAIMTLEEHKRAAAKFEEFSVKMAAQLGLTSKDLRELNKRKH